MSSAADLTTGVVPVQPMPKISAQTVKLHSTEHIWNKSSFYTNGHRRGTRSLAIHCLGLGKETRKPQMTVSEHGRSLHATMPAPIAVKHTQLPVAEGRTDPHQQAVTSTVSSYFPLLNQAKTNILKD